MKTSHDSGRNTHRISIQTGIDESNRTQSKQRSARVDKSNHGSSHGTGAGRAEKTLQLTVNIHLILHSNQRQVGDASTILVVPAGGSWYRLEVLLDEVGLPRRGCIVSGEAPSRGRHTSQLTLTSDLVTQSSWWAATGAHRSTDSCHIWTGGGECREVPGASPCADTCPRRSRGSRVRTTAAARVGNSIPPGGHSHSYSDGSQLQGLSVKGVQDRSRLLLLDCTE